MPRYIRAMALGLSVILCTYNPRRDLLGEVMGALLRQTIGAEGFEMVMVDNGSSPAVEVADKGLNLRVIQEEKAGLNYARMAGIREAKGEVLVFVDDDNILDADYLEKAWGIMEADRALGAVGGIARGRLEGGEIAKWKMKLLDKLGVRDHGGDAMTSRAEGKWGPWEPIGAGMVVRRVVAEEFVRVMETVPAAGRLDRSGEKGLMSGGDSLMARCAYRVGLACSYQPALKLTHVIKEGRLGARYLMRLMRGHGRSHVLLSRILEEKVKPVSVWELYRRLRFRIGKQGKQVGVVTFFWDLGYWQEMKRIEEGTIGTA